MTIRKLVLGSLVATAMAGIALPAAARSNVDVYLGFGPPPVYYEAVPAPRPGWVWVPGYWDWRGHRHHWVAAHWVRARPGHVYYGPRWRHYDGGWHFTRGEWRRWDIDGDGIPNRHDRFPHNPYRR